MFCIGSDIVLSIDEKPTSEATPVVNLRDRSRGFGQLVRARNIKTVGDLSALTPSEIKTLPIRSPKVSNVKKALKIYEQQVYQGKEGCGKVERTMTHFLNTQRLIWIKEKTKPLLFQRKGRGGDELKSFDETEMMTSELEEAGAHPNQDEDDKASGETLGP